MTLANPTALLLAFLAVPIVLLYVLKLQRPEHPVPSIMLWHEALDDVQANTPWQRLRPNLLLFIQLLVLLALVVTLAHPTYTEAHTFSGDLIVIVDESPAMTTVDAKPSRFAAARVRANKLVATLSQGSVMSVIGMGGQAHLVIAESDDHAALKRGIDSLQTGVSQPNFAQALSIASSLARHGEQTRVIVLTSRESGIVGPPTSVPFAIEIHRLGGRPRDLAITTFHAAQLGGKTVATLRIQNYGAHTSASDLDLWADGQLVDVRPVRLGAGQHQNLFWTQLPAGVQRLEARLMLADDVAFDKHAYTVLPVPVPRRILVVGNGDYWLQAVLTLDPSFSVATTAPAQYTSDRAIGFDLVVFDGVLPRVLPPAATLLVAPPAGAFGTIQFGSLTTAGVISIAQLPAIGPFASLLRYVDLSDVHVSSVRSMRLPFWMQPLIVSGNRVALAAGEDGPTRRAVVSFDIRKSDWPLRVSYPIFMHNLLEYLAPHLAVNTLSVRAGQAIGIVAGPTIQQLDVTMPNGHVKRVTAPHATFSDTSTPGFYVVHETADQQGHSVTFASNQFNAHGIRSGGPSIVTFGASQAGKHQGIHTNSSLAWMVALVALGLLSVEWWLSWKR